MVLEADTAMLLYIGDGVYSEAVEDDAVHCDDQTPLSDAENGLAIPFETVLKP
jgi:hypothetical protein